MALTTNRRIKTRLLPSRVLVASLLLHLVAAVYARKWDPSQVPPLQACMREWRRLFFGWSATADCFNAELLTCDEDGYVTSMSLVGMGLSGSIPSALGRLTRLTYLDLSYNQLGSTMPESIKQLQQMDTLILSHNNLTGSIPTFIDQLTHTTYLSLSGNQFRASVPSSLGNLVQLHYLDISNNSLSGSLPASLGKLTGLRSFKFNNTDNTIAPLTCADTGKCSVRQNASSAFCSACRGFCNNCKQIFDNEEDAASPTLPPLPATPSAAAPAFVSSPPSSSPPSLAPSSLPSISTSPSPPPNQAPSEIIISVVLYEDSVLNTILPVVAGALGVVLLLLLLVMACVCFRRRKTGREAEAVGYNTPGYVKVPRMPAAQKAAAAGDDPENPETREEGRV